jgi:predicted enzyme related to lactoylglutathione lyase
MDKLGNIGWIDLTVPDAEAIRDFYRHVTGWMIYITVGDLDEALRRRQERGGKVFVRPKRDPRAVTALLRTPPAQ